MTSHIDCHSKAGCIVQGLLLGVVAPGVIIAATVLLIMFVILPEVGRDGVGIAISAVLSLVALFGVIGFTTQGRGYFQQSRIV